MKNNYPIKYALMPIIEQTGWSHGMHELERKYGITCYIISKCYVINETKKYNMNGTIDIEYQVVFPYDYHEYRGWKREEPSFNLINNGCTNGTAVDKLYDSFEEAKKDKEEKNEKIHKSKYAYMRFEDLKEKIDEINTEFNNTLEYYNELEQLIEENTSDLEVNRKNKEQSIVLYKDGNSKPIKLDHSLYMAIDLFDRENFIVYSLSENEYFNLQKESCDRDKTTKYNHTPLLINDKDQKTVKIVSPSNGEEYLCNGEIVDDICIDFNEDPNHDVIVYTMENYQDIISSYKSKNKDAKVIVLTRKNK